MRLRELLTIVDSHITLQIGEVVEKYNSKDDVPEERRNNCVKRISTAETGLVITLSELREVLNLEELGYSFESGI